jgi:hypothetical protein
MVASEKHPEWTDEECMKVDKIMDLDCPWKCYQRGIPDRANIKLRRQQNGNGVGMITLHHAFYG